MAEGEGLAVSRRDDVPGWLQGICLFTVGSGYALALWAMRVNRFFSSVIRIQTDRGLQMAELAHAPRPAQACGRCASQGPARASGHNSISSLRAMATISDFRVP